MNETCVGKNKDIEIGNLLKGHLKFAILKALEKKPLHGYAIIKRIAEMTTVWKPTTGSMYPMLLHMQNEQLVSAKKITQNGRKKKVYHITKKGLKELKAQQKMIEPMINNMNKMFQKLLPKGEIEPSHLMEMFSKADFMKKELMKTQQNTLAFLILHAKGKTTKQENEKVRKKIVELNKLVCAIVKKA